MPPCHDTVTPAKRNVIGASNQGRTACSRSCRPGAFSDVRELFDASGRHVRNVRDLDPRAATGIASIEILARKTPIGEIESVHKIRMAPNPTQIEQS